MTNPTPSPAPQWAINAAKAMHDESWHGMTYDQMVNSGAAIITKHAATLTAENEALKDKLLKWEIEKISTWEENMKEIGDIMDACGEMDNTQIIPRITALRQWSDQAREALKYLANDDNYMEATFNPCEIASSALAAHPASTRNLRTYEATAKEMFPDKGMEGRG